MEPTPLTLAFAAFACALLSSAVSLPGGWCSRLSFPLLGASGLLALTGGLLVLIDGTVQDAQWLLGLPWLHWHLHLDPLSGFFLAVIGLLSVAVSLYGPGYVEEYRESGESLAVLGLFTGLFLLGMELVVVAADAFSFLVGWELMSVASYFLVAFHHTDSHNRRAAFIYLLMAEVGAMAILLGYAVLAGFGGGFDFEQMRHAHLDLAWSTVAFLLALLGFGMKAGVVPLHVWLPEAHPVAPSHISALMSGVMLKVAIYGFIRFTFDLLPQIQWGWGLVVLLLGGATALLGVLYALMQHDLKRLLAYHSVENIGIILIGLGLAMIYAGTDHPGLAVLGLLAALYHTLNHALFKGLLFLGAGAILQQTGERDMERMGGLIRGMPHTSFFFLIGCISISALPPFNGFVSEWLTFQAALQTPALESGVLRSLIPTSAAALALTGALAAACFVKVYGVTFLGQPRTHRAGRARKPSLGMRAGQGLLALLCLLFGLFPTTTITALEQVSRQLLQRGLPSASAQGWMWLTPISPQVASYGAPLVLAALTGVWLVSWLLLHPPGKTIRSGMAPWDCGFGGLNHRMQYTATAFAMPIRRIFASTWRVGEEVVERNPSAAPLTGRMLHYRLQVDDHAWPVLYLPIRNGVQALARLVSRLQIGNVRVYLGYSFFTLLFLLWVVS